MPRFSLHSSRLEEAKRLRRLRVYLQASQRELANEFKVGHGAISFWESGKRTIPGPILKLMEIYESELGFKNSPPEENLNLEQIDSSWISRNFILSSIMAQIAARFAGNSLNRLVGGNSVEPFTESIAQKLGDTLGDLKGLMIKAGQMMSYTDFGLSETAREKLTPLQDRSTPFNASVMESIFEVELGQAPAQAFAEWSAKPLGVGSIGQVHSARLKDGSRVAVKIQFPRIEKSIVSDLKNTRFVEILFPLLFRNQDCRELVLEFKDRFSEECDYRREAEWQNIFSQAYADDLKIVIPKIYPEWSTKNILTNELLVGKRFPEFLQESTQAERNRAAEVIFRMAFASAFKHHMLNCDPNPGNYLFLENEKVGFIDFGCVLSLDQPLVKLWKDYLRSFINQDRKSSDHFIVEMGYVPKPKQFDFDYHHELMKLIYKPWLQAEPFRFDRDYVMSIWKKITLENPNRANLNLPRAWVFVNRLQWGLYSVLASLNAEGEWRKTILPLLSG